MSTVEAQSILSILTSKYVTSFLHQCIVWEAMTYAEFILQVFLLCERMRRLSGT